jgi:hypothetical protein
VNDLARRIVLTSPILRRLTDAVRNRAAVLAVRLAGDARMAQRQRDEMNAQELELYGLRSDLQRAVARAELERERRIALEARLAALLMKDD